MTGIIKKFNILLAKGQKKRVAVLFFLMLIGAFFEVIGVSLMLPLVSAIMEPDIIETNSIVKWVCDLFDLHSHQTFVIVCIVALVAVFIIKDLFLMFEFYVQYRFVYNNRFATQCRLLDAFLKKPYEYFLNAKSGEILRIIQNDVSQTYSLLTTLLTMATETVVTIALVITIFIIDPVMSTFVAVMLGIMIIIISRIVKPVLRKQGLSLQKNSALTYKWLQQSINGIKEVKVTRKENYFKDNYNTSGQVVVKAEKTYSVLGQLPRLLIEMVCVCSMLTLIALLIYNGREVETLIPTLSAFAMAAVKLMPSANRIVSAMNSVAFYEPALDKLLENLNNAEKGILTVADKRYEVPADAPQITVNDEVVLNNIVYAYPNTEKNVLDGAQMTIPVGKSVGIVGKSGAGKTTAVDIILGLLEPRDGQILSDGVDVMKNYPSWLSHLSYIPQSIFMLDDSIRANVAFGVDSDKIDEDMVMHALSEAQMLEFVETLPDGINTKIGERGIRLSGGQRQRIGIARALYTNPELLIFDEATSSLDNETEAAIMESINSLHGKKTMVIIAHRLQTIEGCDIVYRVEDGRIQRER